MPAAPVRAPPDSPRRFRTPRCVSLAVKTIAPGGFFKRAQETIAIVFCIGVGANLAMEMSAAALQQGMLATLIVALPIIFGGFLLNKVYP